MLSSADITSLRDRLQDADYELDPVLDRIGAAGRAGLGRNSTVAARDALADEQDAQATLTALWVLQDEVPADAVRSALGESADALLQAGLLDVVGDREVRATVAIRPYGAEAGPDTGEITGWICHDLLPSLDGASHDIRSDFVLGVSPASTSLAQMAVRRPVARALDLGTGCGVQTLHLAQHAASIVATDINPRALELARITTELSGVRADLRLGSLYEPVASESFDLIVSNPPFVMSPPSETRLTYREGVLAGDELVRQVVVDGARRLAPDGTMQVLCNWAIERGRDWRERLGSWIEPTGCDAFVVQRERLDPYEYIEIWLADAGLKGDPTYGRRYEEWLRYFDSLDIEGVGMGWIALHRADRPSPSVRFDDWPFTVHQPVGRAFEEQMDAVDASLLSDADLLARHWRIHPELVQETMGRPGQEDPEHIVLRQGYGMGRAMEADTGLAALVGACDGDLSAIVIMRAIASLLEVDADALVADLTPRLRELVADGYLVVGG